MESIIVRKEPTGQVRIVLTVGHTVTGIIIGPEVAVDVARRLLAAAGACEICGQPATTMVGYCGVDGVPASRALVCDRHIDDVARKSDRLIIVPSDRIPAEWQDVGIKPDAPVVGVQRRKP